MMPTEHTPLATYLYDVKVSTDPLEALLFADASPPPDEAKDDFLKT